MKSLSPRLWSTLAVLLLALAYTVLENVSLPWPSARSWEDNSQIGRLYETQRSGVVVEGAGVVDRLLGDDNEGSRHQRFILRLASGQTLLVSHNIDLAPRLDQLEAGDTVHFRGQYEWNERGGVLHWTHHDPDGRRPGGWLRHRETVYR